MSIETCSDCGRNMDINGEDGHYFEADYHCESCISEMTDEELEEINCE